MADLRVKAVTMRQKSHTLYLFSMRSSVLAPITYVTPRSQNDPEEVQRILVS
jgi:hypothetical protein